jgi:alanyl-tRNA synthetase
MMIMENTRPQIRSHTALHVLKGAVQKVLGAGITNGVWIGDMEGRLCVEFDRKPSEMELKAIEDEANACIGRNLPIINEDLSREDAEKKYGSAMYDAYPVPAEVKVLRIVTIKEGDGKLWNVNACIKPHAQATGEIGRIEIDHIRYRDAKRTLEVSFKIL